MASFNRGYKDSLFRALFHDRKNLLELYNALNGTNHSDLENLTINTLEDAVILNLKNDVSFIFHAYLNLYEHQSTVNPNIPLRDLYYMTDVLHAITQDFDLYGTRPISLPTPRFVVFYNGTEDLPPRTICRLSELFEDRTGRPELELTVTVLNINEGKNEALLSASKTLRDYSRFVQKMRNVLRNCRTEEEKLAAAREVIEQSIKENILVDFLKKHKGEVEKMTIYEYNEEQHLQTVRDEGREEGRQEGKRELCLQLFKEGLLTLDYAAAQCNMTQEEFEQAAALS